MEIKRACLSFKYQLQYVLRSLVEVFQTLRRLIIVRELFFSCVLCRLHDIFVVTLIHYVYLMASKSSRRLIWDTLCLLVVGSVVPEHNIIGAHGTTVVSVSQCAREY